ncbi:histidine kinase [Leptospira ryugenii]|uniref:histidine kinase n=2 Tax=Leptospira ryugenii TaxID=1917863 RepID=A0A2P2DVD8_9LEPT|nr:histidine kinase [Leptospira ryugenii]
MLYQKILTEIQDSVLIFNIKTGKIEMVSKQSETFFELSSEEIRNHPERLIERLHPEDREMVARIWLNRLRERFLDLRYRLLFPDGRIKYASENRLYFYDESSQVGRAIGITSDISTYVKKQNLLESSLKENETLLTEVHHRVKNNLAVIISFLQIQAFTASKESSHILEQSIVRIKAIALVHEKLYGSKNLANLNTEDYIESLVENIKLMYMRSNILIELDIDPNQLNVSMAVPMGLMLTEMLTNSFRHAFQDQEHAEIKIKVKFVQEGKILFFYSDNGIGIPEGVDLQKAESIGLSVIFSLCSQMSGRIIEIKTAPGQGVSYNFEFRSKEKKT